MYSLPLNVMRLYCCGWREISNLRMYDGNFKAAMQGLRDSHVIYETGRIGCGSLLFTGAGDEGKYATKFAKDIRANKLGRVTKLPTFRNPNTGRAIRPYIWVVDIPAVTRYCKTHKIV